MFLKLKRKIIASMTQCVYRNYFYFSQELALLHHKTRSATVLCKDEVSLLAVCREVSSPLSTNYHTQRYFDSQCLMEGKLKACIAAPAGSPVSSDHSLRVTSNRISHTLWTAEEFRPRLMSRRPEINTTFSLTFNREI